MKKENPISIADKERFLFEGAERLGNLKIAFRYADKSTVCIRYPPWFLVLAFCFNG